MLLFLQPKSNPKAVTVDLLATIKLASRSLSKVSKIAALFYLWKGFNEKAFPHLIALTPKSPKVENLISSLV